VGALITAVKLLAGMTRSGSCIAAVDFPYQEALEATDVGVVREGGAGEVTGWLSANGLGYGPEDEAALERYADRGWCFVTAKVRAEPPEERCPIRLGLTEPLVLEFATDRPVYPLALSAPAGVETRVVIYVIAPHCARAEGRLEMRGAARLEGSPWPSGEPTNPPEYRNPPCLRDARYHQPWLTKLDGELGPGELRENLVLDSATEDSEYREYRHFSP
jgi:hypothetical protein